jgi:hypothetical protein
MPVGHKDIMSNKKVKNLFGEIPKKIATCFKLPNPEWGLVDIGHSFLPLSHLILLYSQRV